MADFSVFDDPVITKVSGLTIHPPGKQVEQSTIVSRSAFIFELRDVMKEHALTLDQAIYLLALVEDIDWESTAADALALVSKGLIRDNKVNQTLLFRTRPPIQGVLDLNFESKSRSTEETLRIAHNIEAKLVTSTHLTNEYRKTVADEYFKGDLNIARYYIIFRHLFPVKDIKANANWNKHFGMNYAGITLWDSHVRVAKKFHELYRKKDIGLLLSGLYYYVKDSLNYESDMCYITKPYKYLQAYEPWYEIAKERLEEKQREKVQAETLQLENESNKTQAL
jgi:hypothetical protein